MAKETNLLRRGGRYSLRVKVPNRFRSVVSKREIWKSLGTANREEALRRKRLVLAEIEAEWLDAERRATEEEARTVSDAELRHIVRRWFEEREARALEDFIPPLTEDAKQGRLLACSEDGAYLMGVMADFDRVQRNNAVETTLNDLLRKHGLSIVEHSPQWWKAARLVQRGLIEGARREYARLREIDEDKCFDTLFKENATHSATEKLPVGRGTHNTSPTRTIEDLVEAYLADPSRTRSKKTKNTYDVIFRALREMLGGEKDVRAVTRDDCRRIQALLTTLPPNSSKRFRKLKLTLEAAAEKGRVEGLAPIKSKTANSYLNNLAALFNWAEREGWIDRNPAKALQVASSPSDTGKRRPFDTEQLKKMFAAPLYTGCQNDAAGYARPGPAHPRRGRFWVPLLSLYTGMRLNEACQLHVTDVTKIDGIDCIKITEDAEGMDEASQKRVKTKAGERFVPVHPELVKIGFIKYVAQMRKRGGVRLFPDLKPGKANGYFSDPMSKWFRRFLRSAGAEKPNTSFHSFRHSYADAMEAANVRPDYADALGGWKQSAALATARQSSCSTRPNRR